MPPMADFHESVNALPDLTQAASFLTINSTNEDSANTMTSPFQLLPVSGLFKF